MRVESRVFQSPPNAKLQNVSSNCTKNIRLVETYFMTIKDLIIDFQNTSKLVAEIFYKKYGTFELLLHVRHKKIIPREGSLDIIKKYKFHGGGLFAELPEVKIDFDFGEENRVDGFDAGRLMLYAENKMSLYPQYVNNETLIQTELDKLEKEGQIYKPKTHPGTSNYYWTVDTKA